MTVRSKCAVFSRENVIFYECQLIMLSFSVIVFYSSNKEIGLYLLYRKKVISAFRLYKIKLLGPGTSFGAKKKMICLSQAEPFTKSHHFVYVVHAHALVSTH